MNHEKIELCPSSKARIAPYILENQKKNPFILVVPGGGYNHFGKKEQETIALFWNSLGFSSAVLYYTLAPFKFPEALFDLARAVAFIKKNSDEWNIDPQKIYLCGFSAGGHLCASLGCFWNTPLLQNLTLDGKILLPEQIRPDALCLCYPVISADKKICHEGSIQRLTENLTEAERIELCKKTFTQNPENKNSEELIRDAVSLEKHISKDFPKTFVWHTRTDNAVPAENTLIFAKSLKDAGIEFEYHLFKEGEHGLALAENTPAQLWPQMFVNFITSAAGIVATPKAF